MCIRVRMCVYMYVYVHVCVCVCVWVCVYIATYLCGGAVRVVQDQRSTDFKKWPHTASWHHLGNFRNAISVCTRPWIWHSLLRRSWTLHIHMHIDMRMQSPCTCKAHAHANIYIYIYIYIRGEGCFSLNAPYPYLFLQTPPLSSCDGLLFLLNIIHLRPIFLSILMT